MKRFTCTGAIILWVVASAVYAQQPTFKDLQGTWKQDGYGRIWEIGPKSVITYDFSQLYCELNDKTSLKKAGKYYNIIEATADTFMFSEPGDVSRYSFTRIPEMGCPCDCAQTTDPESALYNFDVISQVFRENYAFFDLRGVDWESRVAHYRAQLNESSQPDDLFNIAGQLIRELNDGHVWLETDNDYYDSGDWGELEKLWMDTTGASDFEDVENGFYSAVKKHIKNDILRGKMKRGAKGAIQWGWASPDIGYINIETMELGNDSQSLPKQLKSVDKTMRKALKELATAQALIVDARFNDGGYDALSMQIMGHLTTETRLAFTKKAKLPGGGFTPEYPVHYEQVTPVPYTGPVVFLQGGSSISAAENFAIAMMTRPNTVRVGRNTYGVFSDVLEKCLPNGWHVTISNEVFTAANGLVYEGIGVPPNVEVPVDLPHNLNTQLQKDFQAAVQVANGLID